MYFNPNSKMRKCMSFFVLLSCQNLATNRRDFFAQIADFLAEAEKANNKMREKRNFYLFPRMHMKILTNLD